MGASWLSIHSLNDSLHRSLPTFGSALAWRGDLDLPSLRRLLTCHERLPPPLPAAAPSPRRPPFSPWGCLCTRAPPFSPRGVIFPRAPLVSGLHLLDAPFLAPKLHRGSCGPPLCRDLICPRGPSCSSGHSPPRPRLLLCRASVFPEGSSRPRTPSCPQTCTGPGARPPSGTTPPSPPPSPARPQAASRADSPGSRLGSGP